MGRGRVANAPRCAGLVSRRGPCSRGARRGGAMAPSTECRPREEKMFTIVRKFRLTRGSTDEVARRVKDGFVPLLRDLPGFKNYYLLDGGQDTLISIRVFESADQAFASNETAAE